MSALAPPKFTSPGHLGSDGRCQCANVVDEGYAGGICEIVVGNGLPIGEGGNDGPPRSEAIGNMHLIAAAPDLYAALVETLEIATRNEDGEWADRARAALSKANPVSARGSSGPSEQAGEVGSPPSISPAANSLSTPTLSQAADTAGAGATAPAVPIITMKHSNIAGA